MRPKSRDQRHRTARGHVMCHSGDITPNPKSKLTLECGTNRSVFKYTLQTPTKRRDASYKLNVVSEARSGDYRVGPRFSRVRLWAVITVQTQW